MKNDILVWDLPTRVFHWSLALSFAGAYLTAESERWRDIHVLLGYAFLGLIAFRLLWGLIGSRHARFASFLRSPSVFMGYTRQLIGGHPPHTVGHNPAGAVAILLLLSLGIASGVSGWALYEEIGGDWLEEVHEFISNAMLAVVLIHIAGVLVSSRLHHENLVLSMITGRKRGEPQDGISSGHPMVAVLLLACLSAFLAWPYLGAGSAGQSAEFTQSERHLDDDD